MAPHLAFSQANAFQQLLQIFPSRGAGHLHQIRLVDAETRVHQPMGQVAVVGQQQHAFAVLIEPAHRVNALIDMGYQIDGPGPARRIEVGAQVAARLVDHPPDGLFAVNLLAVDEDLAGVVNLGAQFAHHGTVDGHMAAGDEFVAMPP